MGLVKKEHLKEVCNFFMLILSKYGINIILSSSEKQQIGVWRHSAQHSCKLTTQPVPALPSFPPCPALSAHSLTHPNTLPPKRRNFLLAHYSRFHVALKSWIKSSALTRIGSCGSQRSTQAHFRRYQTATTRTSKSNKGRATLYMHSSSSTRKNSVLKCLI
jgi:hypothetical protein